MATRHRYVMCHPGGYFCNAEDFIYRTHSRHRNQVPAKCHLPTAVFLVAICVSPPVCTSLHLLMISANPHCSDVYECACNQTTVRMPCRGYINGLYYTLSTLESCMSFPSSASVYFNRLRPS